MKPFVQIDDTTNILVNLLSVQIAAFAETQINIYCVDGTVYHVKQAENPIAFRQIHSAIHKLTHKGPSFT